MIRKMQVSTERDGREFCDIQGFKFIRVYEGRGNNKGYWMMEFDDNGNIDDHDFTQVSSIKSIKKYNYIFQRSDGLYYTGSKNVNGFIINNAKKFLLTSKAAKDKAENMSKNSSYNWVEIKI